MPHIIAVSIFLVVAAVYCQPALQGKVPENVVKDVVVAGSLSALAALVALGLEYRRNKLGKPVT